MVSIYERRKKAPLHFWAKANNAYYCAYALQSLKSPQTNDYAKAIHYSGTPSIALEEAYLRESAIALELVLKAVLASQGNPVPLNHNVPDLWLKAGLPKLGKDDQIRLKMYRVYLNWAGRYIVPKDEETYDRDLKEITVTSPTGIPWVQHISLEWEHFDALYSLALQSMEDC